MSRFVPALRVGAALAVLVSLVGPAASAAAEPGPVSYVPPIDAPVVDGFRPPASQFSAGNRGIDYAAAAGDPVHAAAPGRVVFAGRIGPQFHVTVLHDDGIRTSYSFLRDVSVRRGDRVEQGQVVGTAAGRLHFGARAGDAYLDPTDLFAGDLPAIRLVPIEELPPEGEEREHFLGLIRRLAETGISWGNWAWSETAEIVGSAAEEAEQRIRRALHQLDALLPHAAIADLALEVNAAMRDWRKHRDNCTPPGFVPRPPPGRRIAVLVGGLGSSSAALGQGKGVAGVDTKGLGFAAEDTYYFSYQGGHVGERGYGPEDTQNGFAESGAKLNALLSRIRRENPGVPIVLIAHSQGGLVARTALSRGGAGAGAVTDLVTLATPHQGADPATLLGSVRGTAARPVLAAMGRALAGIDPGSHSVQQLSETSDFIRNQPPVAPNVRFTSIAGDGDLVVPSPRARVGGADNRIVSPAAGVHDHDALPGHGAAHREMALALSGKPETCKGQLEFVVERVRGHLTSLGIDAAGVAVTAAVTAATAGIPGVG